MTESRSGGVLGDGREWIAEGHKECVVVRGVLYLIVVVLSQIY